MTKKPVDLPRPHREKAKPAKEILNHIYGVILATPAFHLPDGSKVAVERFYSPEIDFDGELHCGFDVRLPDGSHLEFTVKNTGWGRPFGNLPVKRTNKPERSRQ